MKITEVKVGDKIRFSVGLMKSIYERKDRDSCVCELIGVEDIGLKGDTVLLLTLRLVRVETVPGCCNERS